MVGTPWWAERGLLDGLTPSEREFVGELRTTRQSMVAGGDAIKQQIESAEETIRDELRRQAAALEAAHVASTHAILEALEAGFERVTTTLVAGFHSLQWRLDVLINYARRITWALENPRANQARELVRSGLYAFEQGWWEDARRDLTEARGIYRYNPVPWLYGGKVVFWIDGDAREADGLFSEAARYGDPRSGRVTAEALLERAHISVLSAKMGEAADFAQEAAGHDGENEQVLIAAARFNVMAKRRKRAVELATRAIDLQPPAVWIVVSDWMAPIRSAVEEWIQQTHDRELKAVWPKYRELSDVR